MTRAVRLTLLRVSPPTLRGFQWEILMTNRGWNSIDAEIPPDEADIGLARAAPTSSIQTEIVLPKLDRASTVGCGMARHKLPVQGQSSDRPLIRDEFVFRSSRRE